MTQQSCRCNVPTCHNCNLYGTIACPYYQEEPTLKESACLHHPKTREYLMLDVIEELEMRAKLPFSSNTTTNYGYSAAIREAIALIKGGVRK